jgi:hypothetical protein
VGDSDRSLDAYLENLAARTDRTALLRFVLPDGPLLELELRFVLQRCTTMARA